MLDVLISLSPIWGKCFLVGGGRYHGRSSVTSQVIQDTVSVRLNAICSRDTSVTSSSLHFQILWMWVCSNSCCIGFGKCGTKTNQSRHFHLCGAFTQGLGSYVVSMDRIILLNLILDNKAGHNIMGLREPPSTPCYEENSYEI